MGLTVLITGANGFLGSHLVHACVCSGHHVFAMKRASSDISRLADITDIDYVLPDEAPAVLARTHIDCIVNAATAYDRKNSDMPAAFEANCAMPFSLLDAASKNGVRTFVNISTFYPKYYSRMINYTVTKYQFAEYLPLYSAHMAVFDCTLGHVYGEHDNDDKFIPFVIHTLLSEASELPLTGGKQKRKFMYIPDAVDACMRIIGSRPGHGMFRYDVCDDRKHTIEECVRIIRDRTGNNTTTLRFGALPYADDELMDVRLSNTALKKDFGWTPRNSLEEGLARTIASHRGGKK